MNASQCANVEGCPIFKYFKHFTQRIYMETYCLGNFEGCKRYQLKQAGQPVPENLLPHGGTLWDRDKLPDSPV
mgnify:CR=1 FL=1